MRPLFLAAALALLVATPVLAKKPPKSPEGKVSIPSPAPGFNLPSRTGTVSLDSLHGKFVYVDFWASWCEPCRKSFPWMNDLYDRYSGKGLEIVAINLDKSRDAAEAFLQDFHNHFVVAFDPSGKTAEAFKVSAMPMSYLVDPSGAIIYSQAGFDPSHTGRIEDLIKEEVAR
jgi:cytochrome c biogenesis protein CcmG/thiol:disulfide interchange protein DsbE